MTANESSEEKNRPEANDADKIPLASEQASGQKSLKEELELKIVQLSEANRRLIKNEELYRSALTAGRMGTWETDLTNKTRLWTPEGMALFGLDLPDGYGRVGGEHDEYRLALHPDDRHLVAKFHEIANDQDLFTSEYRIVRPDGATRWLQGHGQVVARSPDGKAQRLVSIVADVTERKAAEDHIQFLLHEISHRSKNLLTVIQSIARRTVRSAGTLKEFETRFERRLQGLAASHDLLVGRHWNGAPLAELLRQQLVPFAETYSSRFEFSGPHVVVTAESAQAIGLAIHELATNAIKHGALSTPLGKVSISWRYQDESPTAPLLLKWVEQGGPPVSSPRRKGFGHVVMGEMVERSLNGNVKIEFLTEGLEWSVSIPRPNLLTDL